MLNQCNSNGGQSHDQEDSENKLDVNNWFQTNTVSQVFQRQTPIKNYEIELPGCNSDADMYQGCNRFLNALSMAHAGATGSTLDENKDGTFQNE